MNDMLVNADQIIQTLRECHSILETSNREDSILDKLEDKSVYLETDKGWMQWVSRSDDLPAWTEDQLNKLDREWEDGWYSFKHIGGADGPFSKARWAIESLTK